LDLGDEIRKLAYELYEKSGRVAGRDLDNWLEAEKMILAQQGAEINLETAITSSSKKKRTSTSKKASKK
jgi:hypothetical protein